jgi:hypothetical protein
MEVKKIKIQVNTPEELKKRLDQERESGGWEVQAIMKESSPNIFEVTLGRDN